MKSINDLTENLMAQLERLNNPSLRPEQVRLEIEKTRAAAEIGQTIIGVAKTQLDYLRLTKKENSEFFDTPAQIIAELPPTNVTNPMGLSQAPSDGKRLTHKEERLEKKP